MLQFSELIHEDYLKCLSNQGISNPTEIQDKIMQTILDNVDAIGISKTGTGKTLAYLLPLLVKIDMAIKSPQVLILTPTHETAHQVFKVLSDLCAASSTQVCASLLIGSANITRQIDSLKQKPRIIVGSAGRVLELNRMKKLSMHYVKTIVIDEADRMLDFQNFELVKQVVKTTQRDRQLLFFSATMDENAIKKTIEIAKEPVIIQAEIGVSVPDCIEHFVFVCEQRDKIEILRKVVHGENINKAIVFINTANDIENMAKRLNHHGIKAAALHGEVQKKERKQALEDFRLGKITLLVASDLAARGLDIKDITHVINLDVPENPTFYLHRVGRCGRMGMNGVAISIASEYEMVYIKKIEKKLNINIVVKKMRYGRILDENNII